VAAVIFDLNGEGAQDAGDALLVESLRSGSEQAYEQLLARFQQPVYSVAMRLLDNQSEAYDVVQEVFLKVFRNIENFRGQSSLKTWIYRITVNEAHNARRWFSRHRRQEVELDTEPQDNRNWKETIADNGRSPFDVVLDHERAEMIAAALERINPVFREAVVLRDITDLSYEEIAEVLGVSLGTVKSRILRGRDALRGELAGDLKARQPLRLVPTTAE
jgi:RNA polymerase sigma-70 factor (ECF subfamily)